MTKAMNMGLGVVILVALLVMSGALYVVDETKQAVITQFGEPIGDPVVEAGLYFKMPVTQTANYFDKRILQWDGDPNQIPTREKRYIWVDTTARWRISDALKFMQSVRTEASAQARLDDIIDAATRDAISSSNLVEAIRNSNRLIKLQESEENLKKDMSLRETNLEKIEVGREKLMKDIFTQASKGVGSYGIELVDVKIKRINYVEDVQRKVYDRMISERKRAAEKFRSEGQGKKAEIEGQMSKELQQIRAQAYKRAEEIKGVADAKAIKIYADAYNRDPDFYAFIKTLESYKRTVRDDTTMMLTTDNEFYEYLGGIKLKKKLLP